jgi:hypothetical protein
MDPSSLLRAYQSRRFNHVPHSVSAALWEFLNRPEILIRLETATLMGWPAVEGISPTLVSEFGTEARQPEMKQTVGHMVVQVMEAHGYVIVKARKRCRSGIFATGAAFGKATTQHPDQLNQWIDRQVKGSDGVIDQENMAALAKKWGVKFGPKRCSVELQRLELGVKLRAVVPPSEYAPASHTNAAENQPRTHEDAQPPCSGIADDLVQIEARVAKDRALTPCT